MTSTNPFWVSMVSILREVAVMERNVLQFRQKEPDIIRY